METKTTNATVQAGNDTRTGQTIYRYTDEHPWRVLGYVTFKFRTGQKLHGIDDPMVIEQCDGTWRVIPTSYRNKTISPVCFAGTKEPNGKW